MVQLLQQSDLAPTVWNAFPASSPVGWLNEFWRATPRLAGHVIFSRMRSPHGDTALANQLLEHLRGLCERDAACCG